MLSRLMILLSVLCFLVLGRTPVSAQLADSPWPDYGGGYANQHRSPNRGPSATPTISWTYDLSGAYAFHQPILLPDGGLVFNASESLGDCATVALTSDGTLRWSRHGYDEELGPWLAADQRDQIYTIRGDAHSTYGEYTEHLKAFDFEGNALWRTGVGTDFCNAQNGPAIARDGTILAAADFAPLCGINADGQVNWTSSAASGYYVNPAVATDGTIYIGGNYLKALNPDGTVKWSYRNTDQFLSPAIGDDGTIFVGQIYGTEFAAFNPDGSLLWSRPDLDGVPAVGTNGDVYVVPQSGVLYALDPVDGSTQWTYPTGKMDYYNAEGVTVDVDGNLYLCNADGILMSLSSDGELRWDLDLAPDRNRPAYPSAPVIGDDGTLYVGGGYTGMVFAIVPEPSCLALLGIAVAGLLACRRRAFPFLILVPVVLGAFQPSLADDLTWTNPGTGDWSDAANWDPHPPAGRWDTVYIDNGGTAQINSTIPDADGPQMVYIGTVGSGTVEHLDGEWLRGTGLQIGRDSGSSGVYRIGGTAVAYFGEVKIASTTSNGVLEQTGGRLDCYEYYVYSGGRQVQSAGTSNVRDRLYSKGEYELSGSAALTCGRSDLMGLFMQLGGSHEVTGTCAISGDYLMQGGTYEAGQTAIWADDAGDTPQCWLSGGTMNMGHLSVGPTGRLTVSDGTLAISDSIEQDSPMTFTDGDWTIDVRGGFGDFTNATFGDISHASFTSAPHTLTLLPAAVDPSQFASYSPGGIVGVGGAPVTIPASETVLGYGEISYRVIVHGNLICATRDSYIGGAIHATGGVEVHEGGEFNLRRGTLTVNDSTSGMSGGSLKAAEFYIGNGAAGRFVQTGGTFEDGDSTTDEPEIFVGYGTGGDGYYELAGGTIDACELSVGRESGTGLFRQSNGTADFGQVYVSPTGALEMQGGVLSCRTLYSSGLITQTRGVVISNEAAMASKNETGTYDLQGGTHTTEILWLGKYRDSHVTYRVSGTGILVAEQISVGAQSGTTTGTCGQGRLEAAGGAVTCEELIIGRRAEGTNELCISDPTASITVSDLLEFGPSATVSTVSGATIHITGGSVVNESTDASAMDGLSRLEMIADGGVSSLILFEVAGDDLGPIADGFLTNFCLGGLSIGGNQPGYLKLTDDFDNQQDGQSGKEAIYLDELEVGPGSSLNLNGVNVYYRTAHIDPSATIVLSGGTLTAVPEPTTFVLLCLAAVGLLYPTRRIGRDGV